MKFEQRFLDDLKARVAISSVAKRHFTLVRHGYELQAKENKSFKVNDKKGVYKDHGSGGGKAGDIFQFLMEYEKLSFVDAVAAVARMAGVDLPKGDGAASGKRGADKANGASRPNGADHDAPAPAVFTGRKLTKVYDYTDKAGKLLYQVCRFEWTGDDGKRKKSFAQRRPSPESGVWIWGLDLGADGAPLMFMRKRPGDSWSRFNLKDYEQGEYAEQRSFEGGNIAHSLYRLPELNDELAQERQEQRTVFLCEGEKDVQTLVAWGCVATTNSGGAQNFTPAVAQHFADAADVVILEDNDDAGRKRTDAIAPMLLDVGARVRTLAIADYWPDAPKGADITDWAERAGGTVEKLFDIVEGCSDWTPRPYESKFGARYWHDQGSGDDLAYKWLVSRLVPYGQDVLIIGQSGSGKSFEVHNLAMHIALGRDYLGRRTMSAGVVYCCYEMAASMEKRVIGYRIFHGLDPKANIPFVWLTRPPGIYATEENAQALADEIKGLTAHWTVPIGAIVIDTHNAATRGSDEISSGDIAKIQERYGLIREASGATILIVGHTNAEGKHRGNEQLFNAIETCILIEKVTTGSGKSVAPVKDDLGRHVRRGIIKKQREAEDGFTWDFVLHEVEVARDELGDAITTVVPVEPQQAETGEQERERKEWRGQMPRGVWRLNAAETLFFKALLDAINKHGAPAPTAAEGVPSFASLVVTWRQVTDAYRRTVPIDDTSDEGKERYRRKIASDMARARTMLVNNRVVGVTSIIEPGAPPEAAVHYLWPGNRPVIGGGLRWPESAWIKDQPKPEDNSLLDATGDSPF